MSTEQMSTIQEFARSPLEDSVFEMYKSLAIGRQAVCQRCRQSVGERDVWGPVAIWQVGNRFGEDNRRILFAGKTARGDIEEHEEDGIDDATSWAESAIWNREANGAGSWAYWAYTRTIIEEIHGSLDEGWERVAFTNLLKCNWSPEESARDRSTSAMKTCCLRDLGVFRREVDIIRPRNIVLYAGRDYDDYLQDMFPEGWKLLSETNRSATRPRGRKDLPWWEAEVSQNGALACRVLRTGHPERKKRVEFIQMVVEWLKQH